MTAPPEPAELRYDDIAVGLRASFERRVTEGDIVDFAALSGDRNPLHLDEEYARSTEVGGRIAQGMLLGAILSRLVGMHLPGRHALYLAQSLEFVTPVRPGDDLMVTGEVTAKTDAVRALTVRTEIRRGDHVVARGRALVKVLR